MSFKKKAGKVLLCLVLEVGALCGVPIRPDELAEAMNIAQRAATQVVRDDNDEGKYPKFDLE